MGREAAVLRQMTVIETRNWLNGRSVFVDLAAPMCHHLPVTRADFPQWGL